MRSLELVRAATLVALAAEPVALAVELPRAVGGNGFIYMPVSPVDRPKSASRRRDGNAYVTVLENMDSFYATVVSIGNPPQNVTVLVDTGSSELWVNPNCRTAGSQSEYQQCVSFGEYNPDDSNTPPVGPFGSEQINYGDPTDASTQTSVDIEYFADDVALGSAQVRNQTFGVVTSSQGQSQGIMGLAPDLQAGFDNEGPYSLLLNSMAKQGVINSRVFALDLRHAESETGAVVYGGFDRNKFIGALEKLPIARGINNEYRLGVNLTSIGLSQAGGKSQRFSVTGDDANVMLDSGTTLTRMRSRVAYPILRAIGAQSDGEGYFVVPCSLRRSGGSVDFGFGDKVVRVPYSDFILDVGSPEYCYVGMVITQDQQILGDSVLRAGYFVFDWDNQEVHIAQAANCGDSDIVTVGSGTDSVPSSTGQCAESDAAFTSQPASGEPTLGITGSAVVITAPYTTVYTVTSCPAFDRDCETGRATTETVTGDATITVSAGGDGGGGDGGDGGDGDSASSRMGTSALLVAGLSALAGAFLML